MSTCRIGVFMLLCGDLLRTGTLADNLFQYYPLFDLSRRCQSVLLHVLTRARNRWLARLGELLKERILILDGAMGTMIQTYTLEEQDYRGMRFPELAADSPHGNEHQGACPSTRFADHPCDLTEAFWNSVRHARPLSIGLNCA
jgi:hypothetical protein